MSILVLVMCALCIICLFASGLVFDDDNYGASIALLLAGSLFLALTIIIVLDTVEYPIEHHQKSIIALERIEQIEKDNGIKLNYQMRREIILSVFNKNIKGE
jgi:hypothetical protein